MMEKYGYDFTEQDIEESTAPQKDSPDLVKEGETSYLVQGLEEIIRQVE